MQRTIFVIISALLLVSASSSTCLATSLAQGPDITWGERDTATYVVSTLNLVRAPGGAPLSEILSGDLKVTRFEVYADNDRSNLYFMRFRRSEGTLVGTVVYKMGWSLPRGWTASMRRLGVPRAPRAYSSAARSDTLELVATFSSTFPE